jgi:asparagine synthase (glutamine-hydrolysing)
MCGIIGYFRWRDGGDLDLPRLVAFARDQMTHRGPDAAGLWASPDRRCVLGSRRLSIRDVSDAGSQPMSNEDGTVWVVFNGEIYNADELRDALIRGGHRFRSRCDTEVLVHLYEERGADLVEEIDGMFSFVVYDRKATRLFGARDRVGVKPLYYALSATRFAFASEPKALLALPDVSRAPRLEELSSYLAFACVPGPSTLHRDIHKLEPGARFEVSGDGRFVTNRYWSFPPSRNDGLGRDELEAALDTALRRAVSKRMVADVPVGATMSGGLDSGLVVAHMIESYGAPVSTFTIGYPGDDAANESDLFHARRLAKAFATDHHELVLDGAGLAETFDDLRALADDPNGSPSLASLLHLAKHCRSSGIRVLQIGEGADEAFGGYGATHRLWRARERLAAFHRLMPPPLVAVLLRTIGDPIERLLERSPPLATMARAAIEPARRYSRSEMPYWGHGTVFTLRQRERLLGHRTDHNVPYERLAERAALEEGLCDRPYVDQLALIDMLLQLPERLLMRVDRATMRHGIEARVPFLDPEVLQVAFRIPPRLRASAPKAFLRTYARNKLPAAITERKKVGFPTARAVFLGPEIIAPIRERVLAPVFLDLTGMNRSAVADLVVAAEQGRRYSLTPLWTLYVLALWAHHWV